MDQNISVLSVLLGVAGKGQAAPQVLCLGEGSDTLWMISEFPKMMPI